MSQKTTSAAKGSSKSKTNSSKSKGGGFVSRQAKAGKQSSSNGLEAKLLEKQEPISPEDVLALESATEGEIKTLYY